MRTRHLTSRNRACRQGQHGVALITTMLLLLLLTAMSLTMVLSVSSDMLLTGYYGNYRGSFYAADSGLNIARQTVLLLGQILGRLWVGAPLHEFSGAEQLAGGNHSQVFDLLTDENAEFGQDNPGIVVLGLDRK